MARIGIALSGGGHRASLFGLGVLLYLADSGKNREVVCISSVSGGSLTNAYVAQAGRFSSMRPEEFRAVAAAFARQLAERGTLWASWLTVLYVVALGIGVAIAVGAWFLPFHWAVRLGLFLLILVAWGLLASLRGRVCGRAFRKSLFSPEGQPTLLGDIEQDGIDHVLCATELHTGEHLYFSGGFVCSYRFGWGIPGRLPLHVAVQASAAFPGAFPPKWLRAREHRFERWEDDRSRDAGYLVLADGGAYDNMADQWLQGVRQRKERLRPLADQLKEPDELLIVNSSASMDWLPTWLLGIPLLGEVCSLLRTISVLYDNTTTYRRLLLVDRFERASAEGKAPRGALVTIDQSPSKVPLFFLSESDRYPERAERAKGFLSQFAENDRAYWKQIARTNAEVKTTLSALGVETSARLILQGYAVAMANLHVVLGYPLLDMPDLEAFVSICCATPSR